MGRRSKKESFFNDLTGRVPAAPEHVCDKEGCNKAGEYRAPKDRTLSDYYWFCLEHVQEYNAQWDYYADMTPDEIEQELKQDVCWQRPTWKLGERGVDPGMFADPLNLKNEAFGPENDKSSTGFFRSEKPQTADPAITAAAKVLELDFPLQLETVRLSYKRLAKKYHPDSNGGNKESEEHFKDITEAYRLIMSVLKIDH
ncbi:MAG: DnaJ domain-containing protein [Alphaproteobacteria bacterium]|nr:DnaJ domain-containing protein [Alphaproteobacteria bacterium]